MRKITQDKKIIELLREYNNKFGSKPIIENRDIQVINLLREYNSKYDLLNEAKDKKEEERIKRINTLVNKLGLNPKTAEVFNEVGKKLAIQLANSLLKSSFKYLRSVSEKEVTDSEILEIAKIEMAKVIPNWARERLTSIMDYVRAPKSIGGLENKIESVKNENFSKIYKLSQDWHKSLNIGDDKMDYEEKHPIILDFRNQNGIGYYWADLETYDSPEECERMGHCGRSSKGRLFSLRSYRLYPGTDIKLNKSHLTAAIGDDGIMYQLKGPKNSKPKEEYHPYILPLFDMMDEGDEYFITGFGKEYASQQDFKLEDLPLETLKTIYSKRPDIFKGNRKFKEKMAELGIDVEMEDLPTKFELELKYSEVHSFIENDEIAYDRSGYSGGRRIYLSEVVLNVDIVGYHAYIDINHDFAPGTRTNEESYMFRINLILDKYIYDGLKSQIRKLIMDEINQDQRDPTMDKKQYETMSLPKLLYKTEMGQEIISIMFSIQQDLIIDSMHDVYYKLLINCLKEYAEGGWVNDSGTEGYVYIMGDLNNLVNMDDPNVINTYESVESDYDEIFVDMVFRNLIDNDIIPRVNWNRPNPNDVKIDVKRFNELLYEELEQFETNINENKDIKVINLLREYNEQYSPLIMEATLKETLQSITDELLSDLKTETEDDESNFRSEVYYWIEDVNKFQITKITKKPSINNQEKRVFMLDVDVEVHSEKTPTITQLNPIVDQLELKLIRLFDTGDYYLLNIQKIINVNKINPW